MDLVLNNLIASCFMLNSNSSSSTSAFNNTVYWILIQNLKMVHLVSFLLLLRQKAEKQVYELIEKAFDDENRLKTKRK